MASIQPESHYASLSNTDKEIIDDWEQNYPRLIQDKARKLIEQSMQSNPDMIRASTRFVRIHVQAYPSNPFERNNDCKSRKISDDRNQALLTVWNVTDEQLDILTEGNVVAAKNVAVKGSLYENLMQLSAGSWTMLQLLSPQPGLESLKLSGCRLREYTLLLRIHLASKALLESSCVVHPEYDLIGFLLNVEEEDGNIQLYLTDESGLIVRVDRQLDLNSHATMSQVETMKRNCEMVNHTIVALQNIRVMPYDTASNCAVGLWTQSSLHAKEKNDRHQSILSWVRSDYGTNTCNLLRTLLKLRIPASGSLPSKSCVAVGYISAIQNHFDNINMWRFTIDCMGSMSLEVNFPLVQLERLLRIYGEGNDTDRLTNIDDWIKFVTKLLHEKEVLLQFTLLQDGAGQYYIMNMREVDLLAFSRLMLTDGNIVAKHNQ